MDSRTLRSEAGALDERPVLRAFFVAAWCGFLGAALTLTAILGAAPDIVGADWRGLSQAFLAAWVLTMIPSAFAYYLARDPHGR